ncbi:glycosyltransferase family 4 protein [Spirulina subsalsa FACHB-351]|uniref:Glycosyltransferase family 4 protein n=1 Tax=Spirulina subsalsa FACHB-351 TaxID=234711 RepID=A0ABT3L048_9CYAN|nr:glycosyltransferase family 4 protein [Spirulina subsalsa]MCW6034878.1 glycosyltransferase family 4 protein [Spirulina subsalsa FACHB-351]
MHHHHIAWLGKKSPFCGNVTYGREISNALLERNHRVSFLHFAQEESLSDSWAHHSEVVLPFLYKSQIYTIPTPKSSKVLMRSLADLKPDLVHASLTLSPLDFRLPEICAELNLPLIATFHPPFDSKLRNLKSSAQFLTYQLYAPCLANYDRVIVFSQIQKDLLVRLGVPDPKVVIIPNGVDVQKYSPGPSRFKAQLGAKRLFVYMGRISTEKNVEAMLKAWKLANMGPDCKLVIVGDGPLSTVLKPFYTPEDGILWYGFVADEQQRIEILRAADAFILPSLVEGLSLSLLEAMACGVACIATDAGADAEVIEDGAGVVMSTQGVTTQLKTLLPLFRDQPELTVLLGQKGRKRVLERYTLSRNITQLEQLYQEVLTETQTLTYTRWA